MRHRDLAFQGFDKIFHITFGSECSRQQARFSAILKAAFFVDKLSEAMDKIFSIGFAN